MINRLLRHPVGQNILYLYGVRFAGYLIPLFTLPYLARVMGAETFGLLAFAQSFALWLALLVEYGFNLSATRDVARYREDASRVAGIAAGVLGAKGLLLVLSLGIAGLSWLAAPLFHDHSALLWWAWLAAIFQGLSPLWYFQGIERMQTPALLDIGSRVLVMLGIFALVKAREDAWRVLALQAFGNGMAVGLSLNLMYREVRFRLPTLWDTWQALRLGFSMFFFRSAVSLYTTANAFILGLFVAPALVAYYAGAEKIAKAVLALVGPISQALYPRVSHEIARDYSRARRLARFSLFVMGLSGGLMAAGLIIAAPLAVRVLLGPGYEPAVPVLRLMALLLPIIALSNVFGIQWMLPLGLDRNFNVIIVSAGLLNLVLAVLLAPRFGPQGMAWAVVISEAFVTLAMYVILSRLGLSPLQEETV
ncbi:O-antigen transporter [Moorella sp. E308F]|jgi:PST family polysaccharide transporter|uniref:flippase n=1 Tax=Moorella sp. E308F TaxID=2572682 RepID=UPI0010FFC5EA|nr:flippase [Moorella sp. E308F]GEA16564.1 O-antigen transporter [Moorella sp. E308F]